MINKRTTIVGIDPDVTGSGVAFLTMADRKIVVTTESLSSLMLLFKDMADHMAKVEHDPDRLEYLIVVEAGYLNNSVWHIPEAIRRTSRNHLHAAAETGRRTGRNHQIAMDIVEIARHYYHLPVIERRPLVKGWSGRDRKITHEEFVQVTGCQQKRTNQDQRDAGLLAWYESGLPIRLKIGK